MNAKKRFTIYSFLAVVASTALVFLINQSCTTDYFLHGVCFDRNVLMNIRAAIFIFPLLTFIFSLILLLLREAVFTAWVKFAKWYIPISFVLIFITAGAFTGGSWGPSYDLDAEGMSILTAVLFSLISLAIIAVKSWKLKNSAK